MRAGLAAVVAILAAVAVSGCGSDDDGGDTTPPPVAAPATSSAAPVVTPTEEADTPPPAAPTMPAEPRRTPEKRRDFPDAVRQEAPEVAVDLRDEEIQAIADETCADLAGGEDAGTVLADARTPGAAAADRRTASKIVRLAIDTTCPDQDRRAGEF